MARITFKVKPVKEIMPDDTDSGVHILYVPEFTRKHCDMAAFRTHPKFGGMANSTLFPSVLKRVRKDVAPWGHIRTDAVPLNVTIDRTGFLWSVEVDV